MMDDDKNSADNHSTVDSDFDVNRLDNKETDADTGFFHVTPKYKCVLALSIIMVLFEGVMIYAWLEGVLAAEIWQVAIWGVGVLLSVYAIVSKSLAATVLNVILVAGISMIPAWGEVYLFFRPIIELLTGAP